MSKPLSKTRLSRLDAVMSGYVERGHIPGLVLLVARADEVHARATGSLAFEPSAPMQRDTVFRIASLSKPITAAAAMILIEECKLRLDEPVDRWLPELAGRRVLSHPAAALHETVPAARAISVRDLLTLRPGIGAIVARPGELPIQRAMQEAGLAPGPEGPLHAPDEWMRRLGSLPLLHQPGTRFMYHTGLDILGVLIARAAGQDLANFMRERLFEPLGMRDTGFHLAPGQAARLPPCYQFDAACREHTVFDAGGCESRLARPPAFASGGGGLLSTANDCLAFFKMLLNHGRHGRERILARASVELMTSDQLSPSDKLGAELFLGEDHGWGFGMSVVTRRRDWGNVGQFGWVGGKGTSCYADPREQLVGMLLTQRMLNSPGDAQMLGDFWTCAYQALED